MSDFNDQANNLHPISSAKGWKPTGIDPPGGGGDNGDMEARISKLEDFAQEARDRLARVETKLDHIGHEVGQFKWWVLAQIIAGLLTTIGTGIAIQQMTVATFQGAAQAAKDAAPAAAPQPTPIIINVPAQPPPAKP